jgi:hypothetical protein
MLNLLGPLDRRIRREFRTNFFRRENLWMTAAHPAAGRENNLPPARAGQQ